MASNQCFELEGWGHPSVPRNVHTAFVFRRAGGLLSFPCLVGDLCENKDFISQSSFILLTSDISVGHLSP